MQAERIVTLHCANSVGGGRDDVGAKVADKVQEPKCHP